MKYQAILMFRLMIDHQRDLAVGGSDDGVVHQQREHLAQRIGVTDILLFDVKIDVVEQRQTFLIDGRQGLQ
ncbi:hypothetical protein D3C79_927910 [compost metagenome]